MMDEWVCALTVLFSVNYNKSCSLCLILVITLYLFWQFICVKTLGRLSASLHQCKQQYTSTFRVSGLTSVLANCAYKHGTNGALENHTLCNVSLLNVLA